MSSAQPRRPTAVLVPGLIAFSMGQTVLFALAGPVFREIGMSESQLGIIISAAGVVFVASSTVWGRIADRWGRKPSIVFGLTCYGLISLAFAGVMQMGLDSVLSVTTVFFILLLLRLMYAALGGGIQPASVALMADLSSEEERSSAVAIVGAAFGIGMVLGPASVPLFVGFGVLTPLYVIAVLGLLTAALAAWKLPHSKAPPTSSDQPSATIAWSTLGVLLGGALLLFCTMSILQQTIAFNLQDLLGTDSAETARLTGFCFMAIAIATLIVQGGVIQVLKPPASLLLLVGPPLILVGMFVYVGATSYVFVLLASVLFGIGFGFTTPGLQTAASLLAGADEQGKVAGVMQATMSAGFVIGPISGTAVYEVDRIYAAQLALGSASLALVLVFLWLLMHRDRLRQVNASA
ncbi:MAG: MFS transporter [Pseudomonadota bacterium]